MPTVIAVVLSYLAGAIPFGWLVAKSRGVDIFHAGSGNIGATNVGRVLGRKFGLLVFLLDVAKGAFPVLITDRLMGCQGPWAPMLAGAAAFVGHLFPIYLGFRGGKGVATGLGVVAVLMPIPTLFAGGMWFAMLAAWRMVSAASIMAVFTLAFMQWKTTGDITAPGTIFAMLAAALVVVKHRANIQRMGLGTESVIADSRGFQMLSRTLHVMAVGLWFGSGVFFSLIAAPTIFRTFEHLAADRADWLPLPADLTKDGATRLAGAAVSPLFPPYFALSVICGLIALGTAYGIYRRSKTKISAGRCFVISTALVLVIAGWPIVKIVADLRVARYLGDESAKAAFGSWHGISLLMNLAVVALTGVAMALAGNVKDDGMTG